MSADRLASGALLAAMVAVGALVGWFELQPDLEFDSRALAELPTELSDWEGTAVPLESSVERILRADLNVQRVYHSPNVSEPVFLYLGYYGTRRGGRPEHTPEVCYPSAGWDIVEDRIWSGGTRGDLRANEFVVARNGSRHLVHFWYQSSRSGGLLGLWSVSVDRLYNRLATGRGDGALVRISTKIEGDDESSARQRLVAFSEKLMPELAARWPTEQPKR